MTKEEKARAVPIWEKAMLTVEEAAAYTGIGINKLREMSDVPGCEYILWVGKRRMFKRKMLEEFLEQSYSI